MKIEKGCYAIVVDGHVKNNIGKIVKVGNFIGKVGDANGDDYWEVDRLMDFHSIITGEFIYSLPMNRECFLSRIDYIEEKEKTSLEKTITEKEIS